MVQGGAVMIHITTNTDFIADNAWDYPLEELGYLCEERGGETFVLLGERLYEAFDDYVSSKTERTV